MATGARMGVMAVRPAPRYDAVAQAFHWLVVALVVLQYASKWLPGGFAGLARAQMRAWHNGIGPAILLLMLARLAWRLTHRVPPPPADLPAPLRLLSRGTHWLFYAILIVLPVLGWFAASGYGARVTLLRLVPLPVLAPHDAALAARVGRAHAWLAWTLLGVIALHVAGALYHALVKRDGVVRRMLPGR